MEKRPVLRETLLDAHQRRWMSAQLSGLSPTGTAESISAGISEIAAFEFIEPGLQDYF